MLLGAAVLMHLYASIGSVYYHFGALFCTKYNIEILTFVSKQDLWEKCQKTYACRISDTTEGEDTTWSCSP